MSDREKTISKIKHVFMILILVGLTVLILGIVFEHLAKIEFDKLSCNDKEELIQSEFTLNGKSSMNEYMIDKYNLECTSYGKFFLKEVEDIGFGLLFIPSSEMQEGVQYDVNIRTNRTESKTIDQSEETNNNFEIEVKK